MRQKLPEIDELPRITVQDLSERLDEIADEILVQNKAFVIEGGSRTYVLCPGDWVDGNDFKGGEG